MAGKVGTAYVDTELDPTGVKKGLAQVENETKRRMGGIGTDVKKGFEKAFAPALVGFAAVAFGAKKAIDAASDLNEQISKNTAVFGRAPPRRSRSGRRRRRSHSASRSGRRWRRRARSGTCSCRWASPARTRRR